MSEAQKYYTPLEIAATELARRAHLRASVEQFWNEAGWGLPPLLPKISNAGVMARQLASFRYEDAAFVRMCESADLTPVWPAWADDKISSNSRLKSGYLAPRFIDGRRSKDGKPIVRGHKTITAQGWTGKRLSDVVLEKDGNRTLVDFHLAQQDRCYTGAKRCDVGEWYNTIGKERRYVALISMFVAHGVLFDDYHGGESAADQVPLTKGRFEPAFHELQDRFGVAPLIVLLPWGQHLGHYPKGDNWKTDGVLDEYFATL